MSAPALLVALALAGAPSVPAPGAAAPAEAESEASDADVVRLRFEWPAPVDADAVERRTRTRTGQRPVVTTTRYSRRAVRRDDGALSIVTARTRWDGDAPAAGPKDAVAALVRAAEQVVQVVSPEGELLRLERTEALRPALARLLPADELSPEQRERALDGAEAATRAQAREAWNLAVGFWTGADLELGERYVMKTDGEVPLLPGARIEYDQEFSVRRRVPCAASERALRCVEVTLRSTPDPAALPRLAAAIVARLAGATLPDGSASEVAVENELLLVTEPATLVPHRVVWSRAVRVTIADGPDGAPRVLSQVDRSESEYRYAPARPPERKSARRAANP